MNAIKSYINGLISKCKHLVGSFRFNEQILQGLKVQEKGKDLSKILNEYFIKKIQAKKVLTPFLAPLNLARSYTRTGVLGDLLFAAPKITDLLESEND